MERPLSSDLPLSVLAANHGQHSVCNHMSDHKSTAESIVIFKFYYIVQIVFCNIYNKQWKTQPYHILGSNNKYHCEENWKKWMTKNIFFFK
jgi:hypothetical protein